MCGTHSLDPSPLLELIEIAKSYGDDQEKILNSLRTAADGCPMCMLAAIRQSKIQGHSNTPDEEGNYWSFYLDSFDFKKERESLWRESSPDIY